MADLAKHLEIKLKSAKRVAILGIGSQLRQDDAAGMLVSSFIDESIGRGPLRRRIKVFYGGTAPENLTGEIKAFKPSHLIIIDTIDAGKKAGSIYLFKPEEIAGGASFSTHKMPAKVLMRYFTGELKSETILIGIQPKSIEFGKRASRSVISSTGEVAAAIARVLR